MRHVGNIQFVQIQRESLKQSDGHIKRYNPSPLLVMDHLRLTPEGVIGVTTAGDNLIDVHHEQHPRSRNRGDNFISLGFSAHYDLMRTRAGVFMAKGVAGENIIVDCDSHLRPDDLGDTLLIRTQSGDEIRLTEVIPIPPCEPFSRFVAGDNLTPVEMKTMLQFLSNGTRGYYMRLPLSLESVVVRAGDAVYAVTS